MCTEHYHIVYCADCTAVVGTAPTGKRIYCSGFRSRGFCAVEDYKLCKHAWTVAPMKPPRGMDIYAHTCEASRHYWSCVPLKWLWRGIIARLHRRVCLGDCEIGPWVEPEVELYAWAAGSRPVV